MLQKQITLAQFINKEPPVFEFTDDTAAHKQAVVLVCIAVDVCVAYLSKSTEHDFYGYCYTPYQ